ncbi:hypothetical protein PENSPDRAFT_396119 [Peniophora sp. CONT]|nr:hypothetical protein PENSPDRAFT_396119 [Peniophora sp. CONT]
MNSAQTSFCQILGTLCSCISPRLADAREGLLGLLVYPSLIPPAFSFSLIRCHPEYPPSRNYDVQSTPKLLITAHLREITISSNGIDRHWTTVLFALVFASPVCIAGYTLWRKTHCLRQLHAILSQFPVCLLLMLVALHLTVIVDAGPPRDLPVRTISQRSRKPCDASQLQPCSATRISASPAT